MNSPKRTSIASTILVLVLAGVLVAQTRSSNRTKSGTQNQTASDKEEENTAKTGTTKTGEGQELKKVVHSDTQWRKILTREQFKVLRRKGTEAPFRNKFDKHFKPGTYCCAACGYELFTSETKFNSGCGWPAFYATKAGNRIQLTRDYSNGMRRIEVTCARCESHLGHVFHDAPNTPTGNRFCINSVSLTFRPADSEKNGTKPKSTEAGNRKRSESKTETKKRKSQVPVGTQLN